MWFMVYKLSNTQFKLLPINSMLKCVYIPYQFSRKKRLITNIWI